MGIEESWSPSFVLGPPLWGGLDTKSGRPWNMIHFMPSRYFIHSKFLGSLGPQALVLSEAQQSRQFPPMWDFKFQWSPRPRSLVWNAPHLTDRVTQTAKLWFKHTLKNEKYKLDQELLNPDHSVKQRTFDDRCTVSTDDDVTYGRWVLNSYFFPTSPFLLRNRNMWLVQDG